VDSFDVAGFRNVGDGPFPAPVLARGSGPSDRDETIGDASVAHRALGGRR